jgi:hypothetical protein
VLYPIRCKNCETVYFYYYEDGPPFSEVLYINPDVIDMVLEAIVYETHTEQKFICRGEEYVVHPEDVEKFEAMVEQNLAPGWNECEPE